MARKVTIEGTHTYAVGGPLPGERREVVVDQKVRNLVKAGAAIVVRGRLDGPTEKQVSAEEAAQHQAGAHVHVPLSGQPQTGDEPPAGNASTDEWAAFVESKGIAVPRDDKGEPTVGRKELQAAYEAYKQQVDGGS